jgi:hypothetical protein
MSDLPVQIATVADRLKEAIELREAADTSTDVVRLRARENHLTATLHRALNEAAVAHRAGDFAALHPRDRIGRFMQKLDSSVHRRVVGFARAQQAKSKAARIRADTEDLVLHFARSHEDRVLNAGRPGYLTESANIGTAGHNFDALHPRDRLGRFMEKVTPTLRPGQQVFHRGKRGRVIRHEGKLGADYFVVGFDGEYASRNLTPRDLGVKPSKREVIPFDPQSHRHNSNTYRLSDHYRGPLPGDQADQGNHGTPRGDATVTNNLDRMDAAWEKARDQRAQIATSEPGTGAPNTPATSEPRGQLKLTARTEVQPGVFRQRAIAGDDGNPGTPRGVKKKGKLTRAGKAKALVASGLASDLKDARAQLADMGE